VTVEDRADVSVTPARRRFEERQQLVESYEEGAVVNALAPVPGDVFAVGAVLVPEWAT